MIKVVRSAARSALGALGAPLIALAIAGARLRRRPRVPRAIWGPIPVVSIKYLSRAAQRAGYPSRTVVYDVYAINDERDFDVVLRPRGPMSVLRPLRPYLVMAWALLRFDTFHFFFNGGFLANTPLRWLECQVLRAAGKKIVLMPYGSDIAVPSRISNRAFAEALVTDYPETARSEAATMKRVDYFTRWADVVIGCGIQPGYCPRVDVLLANYIAIDTDEWTPMTTAGTDAAREVVVVHAPNHRALKGTASLLEAVDALRAEGLPVRLELLEGRSNDEVREVMRTCDIVAEQFLVGYALTAIEGMSLGKPVLSNLSVHPPELVEATSLSECPIVSVTPETLTTELRRLVVDPDERARLGRAGRRYVERWHSISAMGAVLDEIYRDMWHTGPLVPVAAGAV